MENFGQPQNVFNEFCLIHSTMIQEVRVPNYFWNCSWPLIYENFLLLKNNKVYSTHTDLAEPKF